jgi:hypothetical protein
MAQHVTYTVTPARGLYVSAERSLAFLESPQQPEINAKAVYSALSQKNRQMVDNRFDHWLQGNVHDLYFHGWRDVENRECFVFKWKEKRQHNRLYGFIVNPRPRTAPRFQVCVIVSHAQKNTEQTDPAELRRANALRMDSRVGTAIKWAYPELDLQ